jgi:WD40 repeat protein
MTLWKLPSGLPWRQYLGSPHDVYAVAFSPDGMTLATAGRYEVRLWDIASARLLLALRGIDGVTALAFSPNGRKLAACSRRMFAPGKVMAWDLEFGRGVHLLRGLLGQIQKCSSQRMAGCSLRWRTIGRWVSGIWSSNACDTC